MVFAILFTVLMLLNVAFYTLMERKIMGLSQMRVGPYKVIILGVLQPVLDGVKLFLKEMNNFSLNNFFFYFSPVFSFIFSYLIWFFFFFSNTKFKILTLMIFISMGIYPLILSGWSSFSKFAYIGSIRASSQTVSYEIILIVLIFSSSILMLNFSFFFKTSFLIWTLSLIWLVTILSETNRAPFDFSEGESELISGFNIEFGSTGFVLFFLSEYSMMIFFSFLMFAIFNFFFFFFFLYILILVRTIFPRFRYDFLYSSMWFKFLPFIFFFFVIMHMI